METEKTYPTYRLICTTIPIGKEIKATAILQETTEAAITRVVAIGTILGDDTVVADIQPKQVILKKGKLRISLRLPKIQFMKSFRSRR